MVRMVKPARNVVRPSRKSSWVVEGLTSVLNAEVKLRKILYSVTNFLHHGDDYLFVHRNKKTDHQVDSGRLNGIGGKLEPEEDFLQAAIRETEEETGLEVGWGCSTGC